MYEFYQRKPHPFLMACPDCQGDAIELTITKRSTQCDGRPVRPTLGSFLPSYFLLFRSDNGEVIEYKGSPTILILL